MYPIVRIGFLLVDISIVKLKKITEKTIMLNVLNL